MKILFIVLCSLMFFCSCRGKDDTSGGQDPEAQGTDTSGNTNQTGTGAEGGAVSGTPEGAVGGVSTSKLYTLKVNLENADSMENHQIHFGLKKDGVVSAKVSGDLTNGVCVQLKEEDFPHLLMTIENTFKENVWYNCSPDKENRCPSEVGHWVFTLQKECTFWGKYWCSFKTKGFTPAADITPTVDATKDCLVMENMATSPWSGISLGNTM